MYTAFDVEHWIKLAERLQFPLVPSLESYTGAWCSEHTQLRIPVMTIKKFQAFMLRADVRVLILHLLIFLVFLVSDLYSEQAKLSMCQF